MIIDVIAVSVNTVPTAKGSYQVAEITYKDTKDGKVNAKKIMSFTNKEVFNVVSKAKQGDKYTVSLQKNDKGYWDWINVTEGGELAKSNATTTATPAPRSTYETPEERKIKQGYIIRQSCLSNAITVLKTDKSSPSPADVFALAEDFVKWVYNVPWEDSMAGLKDDIPE